jgi:hypothetical protein
MPGNAIVSGAGGRYPNALNSAEGGTRTPTGLPTTAVKVIRPYSSVECRLIHSEWYIKAPLSPDLLIP